MTLLSTIHHTGFAALLAENGVEYFHGHWDKSQRDIPSNAKIINSSEVFFNKKIKSLLTNHARKDILVICFYFLTRKKIFMIVHGELFRESRNTLRRNAKLIFHWLMIAICKLSNGDVFYIQKSCAISFGDIYGKEITNSTEKFFKNNTCQSNKNRLIVIANDYSRKQFDHKFVEKISRILNKDIFLIGKSNQIFSGDYNCIEPKNYYEYKNELLKGGILINCLIPPEAPYNTSILEALWLGMPMISRKRFIESGFKINFFNYDLSNLNMDFDNWISLFDPFLQKKALSENEKLKSFKNYTKYMIEKSK